MQDGVEQRPRTEQQKAAIAEIRSIYDAKLATQLLDNDPEVDRRRNVTPLLLAV